jgi:hypothetical protein
MSVRFINSKCLLMSVGCFGEDMPVLDLMNILLMVIIFIIPLAIILAIPKVRSIENGTMKTVVYIGLGLVMFTMVGFAFNMWENPPADNITYARDIVIPYTQFYPNLILALALAATVLITYMEKESYSYFFAGMGFAVLLPDLIQYVLKNGRWDLALLGCILWAIIPAVWVFMWRDSTLLETTTWEKVLTAFKATFLTYPVFLLTSIVAVFGESPRGIDMGAFSGLAKSIPDVIMYILVTIWLFYLLNIIIVSLMFVIHDLMLHLLNYRRVTSAKGIRYEKIKSAAAAAAAPTKPKVNHYATLINDIQVFSKYLGQVDRIKAASTIGRFKSEYQTLAVKYNEDSKADAEKMIKMIELEFMQKY